ncbi:MAG: lytic transglycosylase domain-containing protein [Myxococcales bacterium]
MTPVCVLNLAAAGLGSTAIFPLSPFFLQEKAIAVGKNLAHRPRCILSGHSGLEALIDAAERKHGLPSGLFSAVVEVESKGSCHRISAAGAIGPAQLTDATAKFLGVQDPYEPTVAIDAGARYLASHLQRFGDLRLAVAAYNAGPGAVRGRVPQNGETEYYVEKVMTEYAKRAPVPPPGPPRNR